MKTLKTEIIDNIQIITGTQKRPVDPVATKRGPAMPLISELSEFKEMQIKYSQMLLHTQKARNEEKKAIEFRLRNDHKQADIHSEKCKKFHGAADICNDEMKEIKSRLVPKQAEILRENTIYCEPRRGEVIKTESEIASLEELFLACDSNCKVKIDGSIVDDFRGTEYNKKTSGKWSKVTIDKIDVKIPTGGKLDADLTDTDKTEIETGRVDLLSVEEKGAEKEQATSEVMEKSIKMRLELETKKDSGALTKSQDFYSAELAKIESKYN